MDSRAGLPHALRTIIACLLLPLHLAACTTWNLESAPPQRVLATAPGKARLTLADGQRIEMAHPRIDGDSVRGMNEDWSNPRPVAVPLVQVSQIAVQRSSPGRTVLLISGIVLVPLLGFAALMASCGECE